MADNFPLTDEQVLAFYNGDELVAEDAHEALYEYYTNPALGEDAMPYGTAKARSGDPYQWIAHKLHERARAFLDNVRNEIKAKVIAAAEAARAGNIA